MSPRILRSTAFVGLPKEFQIEIIHKSFWICPSAYTCYQLAVVTGERDVVIVFVLTVKMHLSTSKTNKAPDSSSAAQSLS